MTATTLTVLANLLASLMAQPVCVSSEDAVLYQIMCVESGGRKIGFHPDGQSYGYFGLTKVACEEIDETFPPRNELRCARKYLRLMADRHCPDKVGDDRLYTAAGYYHGGGKNRRNGYAAKCLKKDDPTNYGKSVAVFESLLKSEGK